MPKQLNPLSRRERKMLYDKRLAEGMSHEQAYKEVGETMRFVKEQADKEKERKIKETRDKNKTKLAKEFKELRYNGSL